MLLWLLVLQLPLEHSRQVQQRQRGGGDFQQQKLERDFAGVCRTLEEIGAPTGPGTTAGDLSRTTACMDYVTANLRDLLAVACN